MLQALQKDTETPGKAPTTRPLLDDRFLIKLGNREFVQYPGLLDLAHQKGLSRLEVEVLQLPTPENNYECIVRATAETVSGLVCTDIGDANPKNTSSLVSKHLIRMASTRAKARVLRDATNIGFTALEELSEDLSDLPAGAGDLPAKGNNNGGNGRGKKKMPVAAETKVPNQGKRPITDAQLKAITNLGKRRGYEESALNELASATYGNEITHLDMQQASSFIVQLQQPL